MSNFVLLGKNLQNPPGLLSVFFKADPLWFEDFYL